MSEIDDSATERAAEEPRQLVQRALDLDLVEEYVSGAQYRYDRHPDRIVCDLGNGFWTSLRVVADPPTLAMATRFDTPEPAERFLSMVETCNTWNANFIGPKASAAIAVRQVTQRTDGGDEVGVAPRVILNVELEVALGAGLSLLQLHSLATWYEQSVVRFRRRVAPSRNSGVTKSGDGADAPEHQQPAQPA